MFFIGHERQGHLAKFRPVKVGTVGRMFGAATVGYRNLRSIARELDVSA
jgi:hypothetical protein